MKTTLCIFITFLLLIIVELSIYPKIYSIQATAKTHNYLEVELNINISDLISERGLFGLHQSDFKIYENGYMQTIKSYSQKTGTEFSFFDFYDKKNSSVLEILKS